MTSAVHALAIALCWLIVAACAGPVPAVAAEAAMSVELPGGKHKAVRLRNLPKGAIMAVAVQTSGPIAISLVSELDYRRFPKVEDPVFLGTVERKLSFTVTIPETGTFYLVMDNRRADEARKVKLAIRAQRGPSPEGTQPGPDQKKASSGLDQIGLTRAAR